MILSRRSFLKLAGLTAVAAAGASMFTGCGAFSTTPITVVAAKVFYQGVLRTTVAELNKQEAGRMASLMHNGDYLQEAILNQLIWPLMVSPRTLKLIKYRV